MRGKRVQRTTICIMGGFMEDDDEGKIRHDGQQEYRKLLYVLWGRFMEDGGEVKIRYDG